MEAVKRTRNQSEVWNMNDKLGMVYRHADGTIGTQILDSVTGMYVIDRMVERCGWERFTGNAMAMAQSTSEDRAYVAAYGLSSPIGRLMYSNYSNAANR